MKGGDTKMIIKLTFIMIIVLLFFPIVNAGPYGYNDSMDLKYKIVGDKIIYGYGNENSTKYATSLKSKGLNWSEWKPDFSSIEIEVIVNVLNVTSLSKK